MDQYEFIICMTKTATPKIKTAYAEPSNMDLHLDFEAKNNQEFFFLLIKALEKDYHNWVRTN